ncbi:hypothetical protein GCM10011366_03430 [Ornithinimicrobium tianjinense]|uniref:Uncharacterized protein n=1 Tax=Ornithinimicrobium tianjinense TaxID=1195761 RepID=A0A917BE12_9MICO|nr:hypothetical protein GCM10011366_03430 [Ornithinimicrobium tianjinense]
MVDSGSPEIHPEVADSPCRHEGMTWVTAYRRRQTSGHPSSSREAHHMELWLRTEGRHRLTVVVAGSGPGPTPTIGA